MLIEQDIHLHSNYSDGKNSIDEMVEHCVSLNKKEVAITDHACGWNNNVFFESVKKYEEFLDEINKLKDILRGRGIDLLLGLEVEVNVDGSIRLDPGILEYSQGDIKKKNLGLDILLGSIHSESFEEDMVNYSVSGISEKRKLLMKNIVALLRNPEIDVFCHPSQALHGQFSDNFTAEEIEIIIDTFSQQHKLGHKIYLELNGKRNPTYEQWKYDKYAKKEIDLYDTGLYKLYLEAGFKLVVGSDAHSPSEIVDIDHIILQELGITSTVIHCFT